MDTTKLDEIYEYWFGDAVSPTELDEKRLMFWMEPRDETDAAIRERFGDLLEPAAKVAWDVRALERRQAVALVVLFDQFPRNMFRTGPDAYAYDHLARDVVGRLTADGWDRFTAMERFLFGVVHAHHEDHAAQDRAVMLSAMQAIDAPPGSIELARVALDQAIRHRDLIRRFGRFPHRNVALGRLPRPEELTFLAEHGRGF